MDAATKAATALQKAQATQIYAGLGLWPTEVMAGLVQGQLAEDGVYPNAGAGFGAGNPQAVQDYSPDQPRDLQGRWAEGGGGVSSAQSTKALAEGGAAETPLAQATPATTRTVAARSDLLEKAKSLLQLLNPISPAAAQEKPQQSQAGETTQNSGDKNAEKPDANSRLLANAIIGAVELVQTYAALRHGVQSAFGQAANLVIGAASSPSGAPSTPGAGSSPQDVKRGFAGPKSMQTWQNQMTKRGWSAQEIEEAIQGGEQYSADNRINPGNGATRYVHPDTGRSVVIDDTTGQVIQLGGDGFEH